MLIYGQTNFAQGKAGAIHERVFSAQHFEASMPPTRIVSGTILFGTGETLLRRVKASHASLRHA